VRSSDPANEGGEGRVPAARPAVLAAPFALAILGLAALVASLVLQSRPFIGGVDFYYYVLFARDLAAGWPDVSDARYVYFPGVYTFWATVLSLSDGSLASLQWAYVGLLLANGIVIGCILASLTKSWLGGVLAASVYLLAAGRVGAGEGTTEPIATLPYLAGVWLWILLSRGGRKMPGIVALASGFGLALYAKQQGGLLALGALGLLPCALAVGAFPKYKPAQLALIPLGAGAVFLCAMGVEGGGLDAVKAGLAFARGYPAQGDWLGHVQQIWSLTQPISGMFLLASLLWPVLLVVRAQAEPVSVPVLATLGLSIFSTWGGLIQFSKRGYLHYALLPLPSAIIASGLALYVVARWFHQQTGDRPWLDGAVLALGTAALFWVSWAGTALANEAIRAVVLPTRWTTQQDRGKVFAPLCKHVQPGTDLLLIPPRENRVHWFCRTRSVSWKVKQDWEPTDPARYLPTLASPEVRQVFVFAKSYGEFEKRFLEQGDWSSVFREMERSGFRQVFGSDLGRLFRKEGG
jgi:hypothetical protein